MKYCFRCGKQFLTKSNLNRHLFITKICPLKYLDITRYNIRQNYNEYLDNFCSVYVNPNISFVSTNNNITLSTNQAKINLIKNILKCDNCEQEFKHQSSLSRHKKKYCRNTISPAIEQNDDVEEYLKSQYDLLESKYEKKFVEQSAQQLEKYDKLKKELEIKIKEMQEDQPPQQINNTEQQIQQNGDSNQAGNINNGQILNLTINNYGNEDLSHLTTEELREILSSRFKTLPKYIEHIHIKEPKNRNIYALPKDKFIKVLNNQDWEVTRKKEFITNMIYEKILQIQNLIKERSEDFSDINLSELLSILSMYNNDAEENKRIKEDVYLMLLNNRDIVKQTYEQNYDKKI